MFSDLVITESIFTLVDATWQELRRYLVQTRLSGEARFELTVMYPELACREALINAIAHRDYSQEGRSIEIYVFDDRMEVRSPGALLSTIKLEDLLRLEGLHQSRNSFVARVLKELGLMAEIGEGLRRIFKLMRSNELSPPELRNSSDTFTIVLRHKPMYSQEELLWLENFATCELDREQKAIVLLGRTGKLFAPQEVWETLGIVDTEYYRQLIELLQKMKILVNEVPKRKLRSMAKTRGMPTRRLPRYRIVLPGGIGGSERHPAGLDKADIPELAHEIYVGNIPYSMTVKDVYQHFAAVGEIRNVRVPESGGWELGVRVRRT